MEREIPTECSEILSRELQMTADWASVKVQWQNDAWTTRLYKKSPANAKGERPTAVNVWKPSH